MEGCFLWAMREDAGEGMVQLASNRDGKQLSP
jgi:hypothetical protein